MPGVPGRELLLAAVGYDTLLSPKVCDLSASSPVDRDSVSTSIEPSDSTGCKCSLRALFLPPDERLAIASSGGGVCPGLPSSRYVSSKPLPSFALVTSGRTSGRKLDSMSMKWRRISRSSNVSLALSLSFAPSDLISEMRLASWFRSEAIKSSTVSMLTRHT